MTPHPNQIKETDCDSGNFQGNLTNTWNLPTGMGFVDVAVVEQ